MGGVDEASSLMKGAADGQWSEGISEEAADEPGGWTVAGSEVAEQRACPYASRPTRAALIARSSPAAAGAARGATLPGTRSTVPDAPAVTGQPASR